MLKVIENSEKIFATELKRANKAKRLLTVLRKDTKVRTLQEQANTMVVKRGFMNDHGPVHGLIVSANGLRILRLLNDRDVVPNLVKDHGLPYEDAQVVVMTAGYLHDIGNAVHRNKHEFLSTVLAVEILERLYSKFYRGEKLYIMLSETLHAIYAHQNDSCYTVEAGVVAIADGTDSTEGRSRIAFLLGKEDIHAISAKAIKEINLLPGKEKPLKIEVLMANPAGIFQIEKVLVEKLDRSGLREFVEVEAKIIACDDDIKEIRY